MKMLFIAFFLSCSVCFAQCTGSSPSYTTTPDSSSFATCWNDAVASNTAATISVSSGSATWSTTPSLNAPTANITVSGATTCSGSACNAGSAGIGLNTAFTDNTNITLDASSAALQVSCSSSAFIRFTGITFLSTGSSANENIAIESSHGQVCFRFDHIHLKMPTAGVVAIFAYDGYGLFDHIFWDDTSSASAGNAPVPLNVGGDFTTYGYQNWNDTTNPGTNQAIYIEDSYYNASTYNTEGFFDGFYGCKIVFRYSIVAGNELGGWHGTDSGAPYRSGVWGEFYDLTLTPPNSGPANLMNPRGGSLVFYDNVINGSGSNTIDLQYYRYGAQITTAGGWGEAGAGLNWIVFNATPSGWSSTPVTLNASNYQTSHSYSANAVAVDTNGCNLQTVAGGTTGSTQPSCPSSFGGTVTDNGGVTWKDVGGSTSSSNIGVNGWCAENPDTVASSNSTCNALSSGDTASDYLDGATPGSLPCGFRDQPGCTHNQILTGVYAWGNSGAGLPSPLLVTDPATSGIIVSGTNYFNTTTMPGYTAYTYPDPLNASGSPTSVSLSGVKISGATIY